MNPDAETEKTFGPQTPGPKVQPIKDAPEPTDPLLDVQRREHEAKAIACTACPLHKMHGHRSLTRGSFQRGVKVLFVGEAPGNNERDQGHLPFIGKSGKMLDDWIRYAGLKDGDWLMVNANRCMPTESDGRKPRRPTFDEMKACQPLLKELLDIVKPQAIVSVGVSASTALRQAGISGFLMVKHPSFFLHQGGKPEAWKAHIRKDLKEALKQRGLVP